LKVLVNGFGISDSGGVNVLEKLIKECLEVGDVNEFIFFLTSNELINSLVTKYKIYTMFDFRALTLGSFVGRLYYENVIFKRIINQYDVDLIYNFTGSSQLISDCPQLVKVHNLLFYSQRLDRCYREQSRFILWIRQVYLKRAVFRLMLGKSKFIELQSSHVEDCLSNYICTKNKHIYIKSDIDVGDRSFKVPRKYDFTKRIKFLYIVGPHFDYTHKNFLDFSKSMVIFNDLDIDFEINITLTKEQLKQSDLWNRSLDSKTNFHGYIADSRKIAALFCDNTILISTSIIETLGLHVIEAIKNGVVTITPNEDYARDVYGQSRYNYELFDINSLIKTITSVITNKNVITSVIMGQQKYLRENEKSKFKNIVDVFGEVLKLK
jgi:hypothetical protein